MHDDELTAAEREALHALPRTAQPGDLLEERTVRALAGRGRIRSRRRVPAPLGWAAAAAACLLFFIAGFSLGRNRIEPAAHEPLVDSPVDSRRGPGFTEAPARDEQDSEVSLAITDTSASNARATASKMRYVVWF